MKVYDFKVILEPGETGGYLATCPSLAGCSLDASRKPLTVPVHPSLKPGLLRKLIRDAQLNVEEFTRLVQSHQSHR